MLSDLRYAVRTLRRSPGFTISAVVALALGIGANTAVFSVVYAVLLKPLPYPEPERLLRLYEVNRETGIDRGDVSVGTFVDWRARSRTLESLAVFTVPLGGETLWTIGDEPQAVKTATVSPALFAMLGARPILGRPFRAEDEPAPDGALGQFVISYGLWQRAFGGASDIVGRRVMLEGRLPREIVGVMPRGFAFPDGTDAWTGVPLATVPPAQRRTRTYQVIARVSPGRTTDDVRRELERISAQLAAEQPASNAGWTARVEPLGGSDTAGARPALLVLLAAVMGVLLIACANIANLLLARASARRREMVVRKALGAGAARLVRSCAAEAALLAAGGMATGLVLGQWLAGVLVRFAPPDIPRLAAVGMHPAVFAFAAAAGAVSAASIGIAPAMQAIRADVHSGLRPESRSTTRNAARARRLLVGGQVTIVVVLLTGALLLVRTFASLRRVDLGFAPEHVLSLEARWPVGVLFQRSPGTRPWPRVQHAVDDVLHAVGGVPGVEAVGLITEVPLTGDPFSGTVWRADAPGAAGLVPPTDGRARWKADLNIVSAGYFPAMGVSFLRGRNFTSRDRLTDDQLNDRSRPRSGVVVINRTFASRYFRGADPIGQTLVLPDDQEFGFSKTIIGVVTDVRDRAISEPPRPAVFLPHAQHPDMFRPSLIVRASLPFDAVADAIRQRVATVDPRPLVQRIRPMNDVIAGALSRPRFNLLLLCSFAGVALALAAIGIYGVIAYTVVQRTREIGIRMALGARGADVLSLIVRDGMWPIAAGAVAGLAASALSVRALRSLLFGVAPLDPVSFAGAPIVLALVALLACYLPARRAARINPLMALRDE